MSEETNKVCELCEREVDELTEHHLYPKSQGKRRGKKVGALPKVNVCRACHRQVHALFSNKQLARELDTIEKLRDHPEMTKFLAWIRKQDPNKRVKVR